MRGQITKRAAAAMLLLLTAAAASSTNAQAQNCVDFEDLVLGATYNKGDSFSSQGVSVTVTDIIIGGSPYDNFAQVGNSGLAGGSGNELAVNNVGLDFKFPQLPIECLNFKFGEYGGTVNIEVNGDFREISQFSDVDGATIGGAIVSVVNGFGNDQGSVKIEGNITQFLVAGQELWIDDVCDFCDTVTGGRCADFDELTPGVSYGKGDSFSTQGVLVRVGSIILGGSPFDGAAQAQLNSPPYSGGSGVEMAVGNVSLDFTFPDMPLRCISLLFGDYGGTVNLEVNGSLVEASRFSDLNGTTVGGAYISVVDGFGGVLGRLTAVGDITQFAVAGQELWIDEVCPFCACDSLQAYDTELWMGLDPGGEDPRELYLTGTTAVQYGQSQDSTDGHEVIPTEIIAMDLSGVDAALGLVRVRLNPNRNSAGKLEALTGTGQFPADSFFDVFVEVDLPEAGTTWVNESPLRVDVDPSTKAVHILPPLFVPHFFGNPEPIPLFPKGVPGADPDGFILPEGVKQPRQEPTFSVAPFGPGGLDPKDLLVRGPNVAIPGLGLGLAESDNVNALSFGRDVLTRCPGLVFSVDLFADGVVGTDVRYEVTIGSGVSSNPPEAAGDEFLRRPSGHGLLVDEEILGLATGAGDPDDKDDLDALENHDARFVDPDGDGKPDRPVFFSLSAGSPSAAGLSVPNVRPGAADTTSPDDILVYLPSTGLALFASGIEDIGLAEGDDIDALCLMDHNVDRIFLDPGNSLRLPTPNSLQTNDFALFSLASGSVSGTVGDIYVTDFSGDFWLFAPFTALALQQDDDLNALKSLTPVVVLAVTKHSQGEEPPLGVTSASVSTLRQSRSRPTAARMICKWQ